MPGILKIGMTRRKPEDRQRELFTVGIPTEFKIEYARKVNNPREIERIIHKELKEYRVKDNREFFKIDVKDVIEVCNRVIPELKLNTQNERVIKMSEEIKEYVFNLINSSSSENKDELLKEADNTLNNSFNKYCNEQTDDISVIKPKIKVDDTYTYAILSLLKEFGGRRELVRAIDHVIVNNKDIDEEIEFINKVKEYGIDKVLQDYNINKTTRILWYNTLDNKFIIRDDSDDSDDIYICKKEEIEPITIHYVSYNVFMNHIIPNCRYLIPQDRRIYAYVDKYYIHPLKYKHIMRIGFYNDPKILKDN